jgi:hypothetical protein
MKIGAVEAHLFYEDCRVDMTKLIVGLSQMFGGCAR